MEWWVFWAIRPAAWPRAVAWLAWRGAGDFASRHTRRWRGGFWVGYDSRAGWNTGEGGGGGVEPWVLRSAGERGGGKGSCDRLVVGSRSSGRKRTCELASLLMGTGDATTIPIPI